MVHPLLIIAGWLVHFATCFYLIRTIRYIVIRAILTVVPCILLTHIGCHDLAKLHFLSMFTIVVYWMVSIRLIHLTVLSPNKFQAFHSFVFKTLWFLFPIVPSKSIENQWPIIFDIISAGVKVTLNHWMYEWLLRCEPSDNYLRMIVFYLSLLTTSYMTEIQIALVRIITKDKYTLQSFTDFPLFSRSLREFWGRRYNRLVGTVLKESIFQPLSPYISSPAIMALLTFTVSGLLHVHIVFVTYNDTSSALPIFAFFLLHGIACCIETYMGIRLPQPLGSLATNTFLLVTAPMSIGLSTRDAAYFTVNVPPLYDSQWIPKLPVLNACSK